jgi:phage terminase large subunit GpA-like protein
MRRPVPGHGAHGELRRSKTYIVSTPVTSGRSNIEHFYEESDQRQFWVPCPHCGEMQVLEFSQMRWPKGQPQKVQYFCIGCSKPIENHHKNWMLPLGEWRPRRPDITKVHGYHISRKYSPVGWLSWEKIAPQYEAAGKDQQKLQIFQNTVLGLPFQETGEVPDYERLYERREHYQIGRVPAGVDPDVRRGRADESHRGRDRRLGSRQAELVN